MKTVQGFTLIELLVVISIIGILATLVTANLNSARSRARDAERKSDLKNISTALRIYYNDKAGYPTTLSFGAPLISGSTTYMEKVPDDPLTEQNYNYTSSDTDTFVLSACLENASDANCQNLTISGWSCPTSCVFQLKQ